MVSPGAAALRKAFPKALPCGRGETGRRKRLKISRGQPRAGSTPAVRTNQVVSPRTGPINSSRHCSSPSRQ